MPDVRDVTVVEALELLSSGALLLDVREVDEWEAGHAPDAVHIALSEIPDHVGSFALDRSIVTVCRSGKRSAMAAQFLFDRGCNVVNLDGGMLAWFGADQPLEGADDNPTII